MVISWFSYLGDIEKPYDQSAMWLYGQEPINIVYSSVKSGGHRQSGIRDVMVLICHVIPQDPVIKRSYDVMGRSLMVSHHPAKFGSHMHSDIGDLMFLVCHVIWQGYMMKESCDVMGGGPSYSVATL